MPDFSWFNVPKREKIPNFPQNVPNFPQNVPNFPQNIPNFSQSIPIGHKTYEVAVK
jgi:hypothetical protein